MISADKALVVTTVSVGNHSPWHLQVTSVQLLFQGASRPLQWLQVNKKGRSINVGSISSQKVDDERREGKKRRKKGFVLIIVFAKTACYYQRTQWPGINAGKHTYNSTINSTVLNQVNAAIHDGSGNDYSTRTRSSEKD